MKTAMGGGMEQLVTCIGVMREAVERSRGESLRSQQAKRSLEQLPSREQSISPPVPTPD